MVEKNKEQEEKYIDGKISELTDKCYVVFCPGEIPDDLVKFISDNFKDWYILGLSTKQDPPSEIARQVFDVKNEIGKDTPLLVMIIYRNPDEKKVIIKMLEEGNKKNGPIGLLRN